MPIIADKDGFHILSLLYQEGPKKAEDIGKLSDLPEDRFKTKVRELYQSSYIEVLESDYIGITKQAEMLLSILGIPEIAANSLLSDLDIPRWKSAFLQACIEARSSVDEPRARIYFCQLKSFSLAMSEMKAKERNLASLEPKLLFAIIIGLDPYSHRLGSEKYCNEVFSWHSTQSSELWSSMGETLHRYRNSLIVECHEALSDAIESDNLLYQDTLSKKFSDVAYLTTMNRMLTAILFNTPDPVLKSALMRNPESSSKIWRRLKSWKADIETWITKIVKSRRLPLESDALTDNPLTESIMNGFQTMLKTGLLESSSSRKSTRLRSSKNKLELKSILKTRNSNKPKKSTSS
ncbi:MAG TPA: hypothetical protein VJ842_20405 [Pyrinomonadaceae bacterium]|nr:hypothetical protein [Pyrinomonadaceae bacterium]